MQTSLNQFDVLLIWFIFPLLVE